MAQGLLDQAQVLGGPEQSMAMQSRLKGGRDRPCLSNMNEKGRPFGLPTENRKPKTENRLFTRASWGGRPRPPSPPASPAMNQSWRRTETEPAGPDH
jgi:hypothetical protein